MPPARVKTIVDQINALQPDIAVAAGDFVGDNWIGEQYTDPEAIAPLAGLKAKLGVYAVLGNNDYQGREGEIMRALANAGIRVLVDQATQVGPIALGGMDGRVFRGPHPIEAARAETYGAIDHLRGIKILVVHRPDEMVTAPIP